MTPQYFKGTDAEEKKFDDAFEPEITAITAERTAFFNGAFECFALGDLLYDTGRAPFSSSIKRDIFRSSFSAIFEAFAEAGTFESYVTIFTAIFGVDCEIEFTVPGPGKLNIAITNADLVLFDWVAQSIVDNVLVFDQLVTEAGDTLVFQTIQGINSQYELEQLLFEAVPNGIFTTITIAIGA